MFTILVYSISPKFMQVNRQKIARILAEEYNVDWLEVSENSIRIPRYGIQIMFRYGDVLKLHGMYSDYYYATTLDDVTGGLTSEMPTLGTKLDSIEDIMRCIHEQTETKRETVSG